MALTHTLRDSYSRSPSMTRLVAHYCLVASLLAGSAMIARLVAADDLARPTTDPRDPSPGQTNVSNVARCSVREKPDGWWLISSTGKRFFSLGVCVFTQGTDRKTYDPANPSFAAWQHYDSPEAWATANVQRLKSWGFTTLGGWSDYKVVNDSGEHSLWMTPALSIGIKSGAPWFDMWDDKVISRVEELAKEGIVPFRDDPNVIAGPPSTTPGGSTTRSGGGTPCFGKWHSNNRHPVANANG